MQNLYSILIKKFLKTYPPKLQKILKYDIIILEEERFINRDRIEGSYDLETRQVILWSPSKKEEDFFIVLTHEWGHKIYNEYLISEQKKEWLSISSMEEIDFNLKKTYAAFQVPEEKYCTLFSLVSLVLYWKKTNMKQKAQKLDQKIKKQFPQSAKIVEKHISILSKKSEHKITKKQVEALKTWIHEVVQD